MSRCKNKFFHNWGKWEQYEQKKTFYPSEQLYHKEPILCIEMRQKRNCLDCNKIEIEKVPIDG